MRTQHCGAVNVEMDCASSVDMSKVLEEMRTQYEGVVTKNQRDAAKWFESKVRQTENRTGGLERCGPGSLNGFF